MKILIVIPMKNYSIGVLKILKFFSEYNIFKYELWVYDDFSDKREIYEINRNIENYYANGFNYHLKSKPRDSLRSIYQEAGVSAQVLNFDAVLTVESDCVPDYQTLVMMIKCWHNPPNGWRNLPQDAFCEWKFKNSGAPYAGVIKAPDKWNWEWVSISPIYKWKDEYCYPTTSCWLKECNNGNCYQIIDTSNVGKVSLVRSVPFLFTLWKPWALTQINDNMPKIYNLDGQLGVHLWQSGYYNMRLLNYHVEHTGGGKQSRKKVT